MNKLFMKMGRWKDQKGFPFKPTLDQPCFFSFGESCIYDKHKNNWEWQSHPNMMYCWKFFDLKQEPCKIPMYNEEYLKWFKTMPRVKNAEEKLKKQIKLNRKKIYHEVHGWPLNTYQGLYDLLELCTERKKKQLLEYYGQCGTQEQVTPQVLRSGKVKSQNYYIKYERVMKQRKIYLDPNKDHNDVFLPSQTNYRTIDGTYLNIFFFETFLCRQFFITISSR